MLILGVYYFIRKSLLLHVDCEKNVTWFKYFLACSPCLSWKSWQSLKMFSSKDCPCHTNHPYTCMATFLALGGAHILNEIKTFPRSRLSSLSSTRLEARKSDAMLNHMSAVSYLSGSSVIWGECKLLNFIMNLFFRSCLSSQDVCSLWRVFIRFHQKTKRKKY